MTFATTEVKLEAIPFYQLQAAVCTPPKLGIYAQEPAARACQLFTRI